MEKISSILPSNARIKSVDMKTSHAARPGAPAFGRMQGRTSGEERAAMEAIADRAKFGEAAAPNLTQGYNPKEARHAKIAEDMANKFFETRLQTPAGQEELIEVPAPKVEDPKIAAIDREIEKALAAPIESTETSPRESLNLYA